MIRPLLRLALLLATVAAAFAADPNTNIAQVRPVATVPLLSSAPEIDGDIGDEEWATTRVHGFVAQSPGGRDLQQARYGEFWIGATMETLYIAVRSAVHPDAGPMANHPPAGNRDIGETVYDDSIELWIHNGPETKGAKYYQIMVNSLGATFDKMHDTADGSGNLWWRPESFRQAHAVKDGVWSAEFAIAWSDLEIADPLREIGMRVCRNYKYPWDQSRWAPGVGAFDSAESMSRVRFAHVAPVVQELGWQRDEQISVGIRLLNPTETAMPVSVRLGYNAEQQPRYYDEWSGEIPANGRIERRYEKEFFTPDAYPAIGEILVTSTDGKTTYYHRDAKWITKPADPWQAVQPKGGADAAKLDIEWHPTPKLLRYRIDYSNVASRDFIHMMRLQVVDLKDERIHDTMPVLLHKDYRYTGRCQLPNLPDGRYAVRLFLDYNVDAEKPAVEQIFEQISDFVWLNNDIGESKAVIPPFTPIEHEGNVVSTVLREHAFGDNALWEQVVADGTELLAAPVHLSTNGDTADSRAFKILSTDQSHYTVSATWELGPLTGTTTSSLEYDGCMKVTLELQPTGGASIDSLDLVIPLKDAVAPLAHICGDGLRINYAGATPGGEGIVWTSHKASRSDLLGTFVPYIWLGGDGPGIAWFASNDKDWVIDPTDKTPAATLVRQDGVLTLRIRLIQQPTVLERTHRITFGLMATPAKPMPENWRQTGLFNGGRQNVTFLGMCMYWGGQLYGVFPFERDFTVVQKIAEAGKQGNRDAAFFDAYVEKHPSVRNEIRWSANLRNAAGIVPYTNIRGAITYTPEWRVYQDEWRRGEFQWRQTATDKSSGSIDFSVIPVPSRIDFLLYYYREFLRAGMDGIYWDNICLYSNTNRVTADGYTRPDGYYQPEVDIWQLREVTRRTAVLAHELGKGNVNMPHMTNASLAPVFSWTGFYLGWEWKYGDSDWQTRFTREYIRAINTARQTGNVPGALEGHTHQIKDPEQRAWVQRTRVGVVLTHEIILQLPDKLLSDARQALFAMGYGDGAVVHNYWTTDPVASVQGIDSSWLVVESQDQVMVILCDWGDSGTATVQLDTGRLGLPTSFTAVNWEDAGQRLTATNGAFTTDPIKRHDFRVYTIAKEVP